MDELKKLELETIASITAAEDEHTLESIRVATLGRKGSVSHLMKILGQITMKERQVIGPALNRLKSCISHAILDRKETLKRSSIKVRLPREVVDVTLPVRPDPFDRGHLHPVTQVTDEIISIFSDMDFAVLEGPEIETDYYNFTALNFPHDHPAREMHDTFFFSEDENGERKLLRTHTSPMLIRAMETKKIPIRVVIPGKTYRQDLDTTHSPMFHQLEGLVIEKNTNIAHLKWVLQEFCRSFFDGSELNMRFRPSFFPFTEPSLEVDIQCDHSDSEVKVGEGGDWMEIIGCGMVHPNVLCSGGLDPDIYQGFAWGLGIDRITMLKYGMPDLRSFFEGDQRWINHYGFKPLHIPIL
ncbi:phenylalanine--tRNA ligase subunit alpha [Candidatus Endowatersipora endosymbiont of Watersipora subatra]|uniref:phenylalanine--tRNA ligase subunit alpha n=1 Tax=Candidatus Endowatersipora endosymbiont of Watersipora subatra TaxID=3077946 RepID=UPI00312CA324